MSDHDLGTSGRARWAARGTWIAVEALIPLLLLVAWGAWSATANSFYFPPLTDILSSFRTTWLFARFGSDVVPSLLRLFAGYAAAVVVGIPLGALLGLSPLALRTTRPVIEFVRSIPPSALIPFGIVVLGLGNAMKVFVIALACLFPVLLNTVDGVRGIDPVARETSRMYGIGAVDHVRGVVLPAATPRIAAGLRTSLALALTLTVITEMAASTNGIGYFILQAQRSFPIPEMWSGMLLLGLLGYLLNAGFALLERRLLAWHRGARGTG
ncbi:MAG TPA: ABC transporter permease [Candidatus Dormibacteraeota bacterium]|nr:ABC transporter permease [Candidatus Dormibacteraeota bacterium]